MQERRCKIHRLESGAVIASIAVRNYGVGEWMLAEQFDVTEDVTTLIRENIAHILHQQAERHEAEKEAALAERFQQTQEKEATTGGESEPPS
jgi:hypothetical protein